MALALLVVVATAVVVGGRTGSDGSGNGRSLAPSPGAPVPARWRAANPVVWEFGLPGNYLGFGQATQLTCAAGSSSTCYVMVQGNGIRPNGTLSVSAPALAPLSTSVFVSTDAGTNWKQLRLPDDTWLSSNLACPGTGMCEAGAIVGASAGPAPGQTGRAVLLTTVDGGQHWSVHRLPAGIALVTSLSCPTSLNCAVSAWPRNANVIAGRQPYAGADRFYPTIDLSTDDGGATWSRAMLPSAPRSVYFQLSSLTCPRATQCVELATTSRIVDASGSYRQTDDTQLLLSSDNGGRSWVIDSLPPAMAAQQLAPVEVSCSDGQSRCFAIASPSPTTANQPSSVLLTSTGDHRTWTEIPSTGPVPASGWALVDVEGTQPCRTSNFCSVVTAGSTVGITANGSLRWRVATFPAVPAGYAPDNSVTQTWCVASGTCLALQDMTPPPTALGLHGDGARVLTDSP